MHVGVGYSDNPDSTAAGLQAAKQAVAMAACQEPCDLVLLFNTAPHNQQALRDAVVSVVGTEAKIYGGGAVGVITNEVFGYAGDQVGVACIWLEGTTYNVLADGGLLAGEAEAGERIGRGLSTLGVTPSTASMLFYDAVDVTGGGVKLLMATWLLEGMQKGLGFLPMDLTGAGMQGDHSCTPTGQYIGDSIAEHYAMALAFSDDIRLDSTILHGCRPASQYYTVTKAEGPVILEINGKPALAFMDELLDGAIRPEEYPFFLLFGINHGDRWGSYDENNYASRLCLGIDPERGGIVMFEPDMVAGTQFQLMFRSMDFDYMKPKIESLFEQLGDREPVFAMYIDCAGRCAGYGGLDLEDAIVVQQAVDGRVPLLGLYTGVEIAPIGGRPRGLDWTGVFCLFSKKKNGGAVETARSQTALWEANKAQTSGNDAVSMEALLEISERNAAKVLALDTQSIAIRHELEQKRRGFSLLAELSVSLRQSASYESVFILVARRINAALNMQKTAVLVPAGKNGLFMPSVLQGFSMDERARLAGQTIAIDARLLDPENPVLVTAADPDVLYSELRDVLNLPYFISSPVILQNEVAAILVTGRMVEATPFLSRLGRSDMETVQAISALLASVLVHQRLEAAEERAHIMLDAMPLCCVFWDENGNQTDCNEEALRLFGLSSKAEFLQQFYRLAPAEQPDGRPSEKTARALVLSAFRTGTARYEWVYMTRAGELIPSEVTLVRVPRGEDYTMVGYIRDLREQKAAMAEMRRARDLAEENAKAKSEFLAAVSHEVRTPMNAIIAMARAAAKVETADETSKQLIEHGVRSTRVLSAAIDSILDFSRIEAGQVTLSEKPFVVRDMVSGVVDMLSTEADNKSLPVQVIVAPDVPQSMIGDPGRLEQAVYNIIANAIKFTEKGEITVRVSSTVAETPGTAKLAIAVQDTGIGINEDELARLFEPLTTADASYSRKQSGIGMGLAVSRSLAQMMQGEITCESVPNKGSVFTISVTLGLPEDVVDEQASISHEEALAGMRVLVAEDNMINQMIVEDLLDAAGIIVTTANNGLEALKALEGNSFDLVLMDIQMPEMDGLTAAAQIRANPKYSDMPILAMTANSAEEHRKESLASGMNDHLTKPVDVAELYAALRRWGKRDKQ